MHLTRSILEKQPLIFLLFLALLALPFTGFCNTDSTSTSAESTNSRRPNENRLIVLTVAAAQNQAEVRNHDNSRWVAESQQLNVKFLTARNNANPHFLVKLEVEKLRRDFDEFQGHGNEQKVGARVLENSTIVMYTTNEALVLGSSAQIISAFLRAKANIVFCATGRSRTSESDKEFPCLDGYIGRASALLEALSFAFDFLSEPGETGESETAGPGSRSGATGAMGMTKLIKNAKLRTKFGVKLDKRNSIFQIVNKDGVRGIGSCSMNKVGPGREEFHQTGILELCFPPSASGAGGSLPELVNTLHQTRPLVLFTAGHSSPEFRSVLNYFGNYLSQNWNDAKTDKDEISGLKNAAAATVTATRTLQIPTVLLGLFVLRPTPFLAQYFEAIAQIDYPPDKLHIFLYNGSSYLRNYEDIDSFLTNSALRYASVTIVQHSETISIAAAKKSAIDLAIETGVDFYFYIDAEAHLTNPQILHALIEQNRPVISPLLVVPLRTKSNYWGMVSARSRPRRAKNYGQIVSRAHRGLWSVPCVSGAYLINMTSVKSERGQIQLDYAESAAQNSKNFGGIICQTTQAPAQGSGSGEWPFFLSNRLEFGHSISNSFNKRFFDKSEPEQQQRKVKNIDLFQLQENRRQWELNYLHPNWSQAPELMEQPCPDVFWFPLVSERFCAEIIAFAESFENWTVGTNYEVKAGESHPNWDPFPTVDIGFKQIGFDRDWLEIVRRYVRPLQRKVFGGYDVAIPFIDTSLVIRYRPEEQSSNRPHHDTSTYTLNMALNAGFEGGGCRFLRQNCSVTRTRVGWALIHPGDLTHLHEGLSTTKGTRYILVSFVDPREKDIGDEDDVVPPWDDVELD